MNEKDKKIPDYTIEEYLKFWEKYDVEIYNKLKEMYLNDY